jgi:hypothetical protein
MTDTRLIYIIRQTPSLNRLWNKLSNDGKARVVFLAAGDDFMLDTILFDVLEEEHDARKASDNL